MSQFLLLSPYPDHQRNWDTAHVMVLSRYHGNNKESTYELSVV